VRKLSQQIHTGQRFRHEYGGVQVGGEIRRAQFFGMLLAMKINNALNRINISMLSANTEMFDPDAITHLVQYFWLRGLQKHPKVDKNNANSTYR